jgi:hypothetical protein
MSSSTIGRDEVLREAEALGADLAALRANLALSPAERIAELAVMNRLHAAVQARTVPAALRAALERREMEAALQQLTDREA